MAFERQIRGLGVESFESLEAGVEFHSTQEQLAYAEATLGMQFSDFFGTSIGRYVVGRAQEQIEQFTTWAMSKQAVNATAEEFREKREKAAVAANAITWFADAIAAGLAAESQLKQQDDPQ